MAQPPPGQGGKGQAGPGTPKAPASAGTAAPRTATGTGTPAPPAAPPRTATGTGPPVASPAPPAAPRTATATGTPVATPPGAAPPRTTTNPGAPAPDGGVRRSPTLSALPNVRAGITAFETTRLDSKTYNKKMGQSAFDGKGERSQADTMLGVQARQAPVLDAEPNTDARTFDGETAPPELTSRDVWRAVNPPLQSREGRRSAELYKQVINQFAVGTNPRYEPDADDKPRAHIFVWDVSRAMNAEIPHFAGARELTIAQTVDWVRREGSNRGWRKTDIDGAVQAANEGMLVVAVPKDPNVKLIALVRPGPPEPDGRPRFAASALRRGSDLGCRETFGVMALEYFLHP